MKKAFGIILVLALLFSSTGVTAYAAMPAEQAATSSSKTADIAFNTAHSGSATVTNVGSFPKISVTLNGNPRMNFKVTVSCPSGVYTISDSTPADGTTVSKTIWTFRSGDTFYV